MLDHGTGIVIGETATHRRQLLAAAGRDARRHRQGDGDRHPKIGDNVMIGAGAKVLGNITVGNCSRVASGSVVLKEVPPETTVAGVPAKVVGPAGCPSPPAPWTSGCCPTTAAAARSRAWRASGSRPFLRAAKGPDHVNPQEMVRVQTYLRKMFGAKTLSVRAAPEEQGLGRGVRRRGFVGTLTVDNEDGEVCYQFQMAILELDLERLIVG